MGLQERGSTKPPSRATSPSPMCTLRHC